MVCGLALVYMPQHIAFATTVLVVGLYFLIFLAGELSRGEL